MSAAIAVARGSSSCSKPSRFASNAVVKKLTPVALPPGRLKLATRPRVTGSTPAKNTIGIVEVAPARARAKSEERRTLRTAYAVRSTIGRLARPSRSLCDGDHENTLLTGQQLRRVRLETYPPGCLVGRSP